MEEKKIYIRPNVEVISIGTEDIVTASGFAPGDETFYEGGENETTLGDD